MTLSILPAPRNRATSVIAPSRANAVYLLSGTLGILSAVKRSMREGLMITAVWVFGALGVSGQVLPFVQDGGVDAVVVVEAEHYSATTGRSAAAWSPVLGAVYAGGSAMQVLPNVGSNINSNVEATSPRLDYQIEFIQGGRHYVAVRGFAKSGADDSVHAGLNGLMTTNSDRIGSFPSTGRWINRTFDTATPLIYIDVPGPGVHTLNLWMREDGVIIDKVVLSTSPYFLPSGFGPPESPRQGDAVTSSEPEGAGAFSAIVVSNGQVHVTFEPVAGAVAYTVVSSTNLADPDFSAATGQVAALTATLAPDLSGSAFLAVAAAPGSTNAVWADMLFNRIGYGPTPDLIDRVLDGIGAIGPAAYLDEQLAPELIDDPVTNSPLWQTYALRLAGGSARLPDLQAWHVLNAVASERQLHEVLVQFVDNHFTTYFWKTRDWFVDEGFSSLEAEQHAALAEFREQQRWRSILLDPNGTFQDLLRASCESPSMIIYLDTAGSRSNAPNENFSREILELFTMGVDNGYSQTDIERMSPAWTGWQVGPLDPALALDAHSALYTNPAVLVPVASSGWSYRKGLTAPPANWNQSDYTPDTNWIHGAQLGIGYSDLDDNTVLADMRYLYSTVYLRNEWVLDPGADLTLPHLRLYVDDAAIVWINGIEVARFNVAPGATKAHNGFSDVTVNKAAWQVVDSPALAAALQPGTNLIAVHVLNQSLSSSDLSFDLEIRRRADWSLVYNPSVHNSSAKIIFSNYVADARFGPAHAGVSYQLSLPERSGTNGMLDGYDVVAHLADLPHTQEFICKKLCEVFVHDAFTFKNYYNLSRISQEDDLLRACMAAWNTPGPDGRKGNIRSVVRTILTSELFRDQAAANQKVKTPFELIASMLRSLRVDLGGGTWSAATLGSELASPMSYMGMKLFERFDPDGWPEVARKWIDTGTINERMRFAQQFARVPGDGQKTTDYGNAGTNTVCQPAALLMARLPPAVWNDADAIADQLIRWIFRGEGWANLGIDRAECVRLLDSDDTGSPGSSPFVALTPGSAAYDQRIRALVGVLWSSPRFQEQ